MSEQSNERELFETWYGAPRKLERSESGYKFMAAHTAWTTWQAARAPLLARIADLDFEVSCAEFAANAAKKDAERLDWLIEHSDATVCSGGLYGPFHIWFRHSNRVTDKFETARAAIDAAIQEAPQ